MDTEVSNAAASEIFMPQNWNDQAGWERFYQYRITNPRVQADTGSISLTRLPGLVTSIKNEGWNDVWIPGVGISPLGFAMSALGLAVVVTDISEAALEYQQDGAKHFQPLLNKLGTLDSSGSLRVERHDFRSAFASDAFDVIINVKAIQGFELPDIRQIAATHALSLRKGKRAYFDTNNVQGERRESLEQALEDAGFLVPMRALEQWYRQAARDTGIPHLFVLGAPHPAPCEEYTNNPQKREEDRKRLRAISEEHRARLPAAQEAERLRITPEAKIATVIYSTG